MTSTNHLGADVSRETLERLEIYESLLIKWNAAINLVSPQTLAQVWSRHFLDSAQLFDLAPPDVRHWADLGSGGGFPGMVVAILAKEKAPDMLVSLVESDQRKAAFLATVARTLDLPTRIHTRRIEQLDPLKAGILSARALAPLAQLLDFAERHLSIEGTAVFPKGTRWRDELAEAQKKWSFGYDVVPSRTDAEAVILKIEGLKRV